MTRIVGVIGHPIGHSLSPAMHAAAIRAAGLDAVYTAIDTSPQHLAPILQALIFSGVEGLNVTVPLKERILPLLNRVDPEAAAVGAINTVVIRDRKTIGFNTDGIGFRRAIQELGVRPHRTILLGAGGAARAVAWELTRVPGSCVTIANRHPARARALARWLARRRPRACVEASSLRGVALDGVQLVVNATTLGMRAADALPIDPKQLRRGMVVYDLVYTRETPLVSAARRRGCVAVGGLSMLLYQGAESFRLWFHRDPPIDVMRKALEQVLRTQRS